MKTKRMTKSPRTTTKRTKTKAKRKTTRKWNNLKPLAILGLCLLTIVAAPSAWPQDKKAETLRTIHGMVLDKDENPAPSSIVYLLNRKTQAVRTYIADSDGKYRFSGLDPNVDYEVHAEHGEMASGTR